ncbi:MAG: YncE family protein [Chitinophagaceae bacterium]|nr:MAG: YncE family protein [Chitinophagaceae bacterium]
MYKSQQVPAYGTEPGKKDTAATDPVYTSLKYYATELLKAAPGTKSVLFNEAGTSLFAMNLEGMSVYQFDQGSRKVVRQFRFKPTKGTGWDYETDKPISSFEEKPVEACFSHDDRILWVSLHNAGGIVPLPVDSSFHIPQDRQAEGQELKKVYITGIDAGSDSLNVPLIETGKTPKIISRTADSRYLLVSNWHSYNVSVLETDTLQWPYAKLVTNIPVSSIPRGIVVDDQTNKSYVAIMGGATIDVIDNNNWKKQDPIQVASNPRHIVMDSSGHIFVSYNKLAKIACLDAATGKTLFTAATSAQPRTIILSDNKKFLFVTCYSSDKVEVYKINDDSFTKLTSLPCKGHPVGVDLFENDSELEAWVCSYTTGSISVFRFKKQ